MYLVVIIILNFRKTVTCHFWIWHFWNWNQNWNLWNWNWNWNLLWVVELEFKIMELELNWWNGIDPKTVVGYILIMNQQTCRWKKWPHRCIFTWNWFCGKATSVSLIAIKPSHLYRTSVSGICKLYAFPYILSRVLEKYTLYEFFDVTMKTWDKLVPGGQGCILVYATSVLVIVYVSNCTIHQWSIFRGSDLNQHSRTCTKVCVYSPWCL